MEVESLTRWLAAFALVLGIINTIWVWMRTGGREVATKIKDLRAEFNGALKEVDEDLEEHDRRIQKVESEIGHMPSKDDVNQLKLSISDMNGKLGTFDAELASVARTVRRIEDILLGGKA